jgi:hypothetical protein
MAEVALPLLPTPANDTAPLQNFYPPLTDPTRLQLAYGRRTIPKLVDEAMSEELIVPLHYLIT